ncbi:hypothetical protein ASE00_17570 [Sphingomonas sp. Root710]|uniref:hypothetical protein n=1 Tax=Sphingomonas sp. Root710 TaxID=1736594 RepID=UPI0006F23E06|nr:hypothetical protein [Sphingomonas sp. Root710]KRB80825.1 hypothetical protein ASE00_17570 [Sphingomonas sp. Root710]
MTPDPDDLRAARAAAAKLLGERGYAREAAMVLAGEGDDFAEVRTALALLAILAAGWTAQPAPRRAVTRNGHRIAGEEC